MIVQPPWELYGHGYVIFLSGRPMAGRSLARGPVGPAVLMMLDYQRSTAGPYREVLFIPGYFSIHRPPDVYRGHSISFIVVTSETSRASGIANWGIPKLLGKVVWEKDSSGLDVVQVSDERNGALLRAAISGCGPTIESICRGLSVPLGSRFLPHTLVQPTGPHVYKTVVRAAGRARVAGKTRLETFSPVTEALARRRVLLTLRIERFVLHFPPTVRCSPSAAGGLGAGDERNSRGRG